MYPGALPQLEELRKSIKILLMVDNEAQVQAMEEHAASVPSALAWDVFIKVDTGDHRAGLEADSRALESLVRRIDASSAVRVHGFYCHAGHSNGCRSTEATVAVLRSELEGVSKAAGYLQDRQLVLSVGSTPAAHVVREIRGMVPANVEVELHAGSSAS